MSAAYIRYVSINIWPAWWFFRNVLGMLLIFFKGLEERIQESNFSSCTKRITYLRRKKLKIYNNYSWYLFYALIPWKRLMFGLVIWSLFFIRFNYYFPFHSADSNSPPYLCRYCADKNRNSTNIFESSPFRRRSHELHDGELW
jgi:hypothetical protein